MNNSPKTTQPQIAFAYLTVDKQRLFGGFIHAVSTVVAALCILCNIGCGLEKGELPLPHAFPKVEYPKGDELVDLDKNFCNFTFKYPKYVQFRQDSVYFDEKPKNPCWFNLDYPKFVATLHCSYYPISSANTLDNLVADAHELANKHNIKADYIEELVVKKPNRVSGKIFDIQGPAASPFQFYLTDGSKHFFRASLYFNTKTRPDSLAPILNFVKTDITGMINTFEWNN